MQQHVGSQITQSFPAHGLTDLRVVVLNADAEDAHEESAEDGHASAERASWGREQS